MQHHPLPFPPHSDDLARVTATFTALADPTRTQLVVLLSQAEHPVQALVDALQLPQSTVSRHLAHLRAQRLVRTRRDGTSVHYTLADTHLARLLQEAFSHAQHERLGLPDHHNAEHAPGGVH